MRLKWFLGFLLVFETCAVEEVNDGSVPDLKALEANQARFGWEWGQKVENSESKKLYNDHSTIDAEQYLDDKWHEPALPLSISQPQQRAPEYTFSVKLKTDPNRLRLHPLDPLTESEINATSRIIKSYRGGDYAFKYIALREPEKSSLLPFFLRGRDPPPLSIPRRAFAVLMDRTNGETNEVVVNLDHGEVESWNQAPVGAQAPYTPEDLLEAERIAREDRRVQERSRELGWDDINLVNADPWSMGYVGDRPEYEGRRLVQLYLYGRNHENDNHYAHPFDFIVIVDLIEGRVIAFEELPTHDDFDASNKKGNVVPREEANYDPQLRDPNSYRKDLNPINVTQRLGPSFTMNGNAISWQKFNLRIGFNGREGLVIYNVNYKDGGKLRPLFYRMSLAEMFIPYGDPRPPYHRKHVFDEGQYGIGFNANELQPQINCIGEIRMVDATLHNEAGGAERYPQVVCIHEEDSGILWTHTDFRTGQAVTVRSQRLVLTFTATVGNYDYIYAWHFYQDGTIDFDVKLSGILSVNLLAVNATPAGHGTIVRPQINAQYHQHFFCLRLDPEIDGNKNTVVVQDAVPLPYPTGSAQNPYGQGFTTKRSVLRTVGQARTNIAPESSRVWHIRNPSSINPYTKGPVAWKLMPWPSPPTFLRRDSPIHDQAEWLDYNTWVTPYEEGQLFPGGFYLNNSGLPEWVGQNKNRNIENEDIVLWHNFGLTHIPRTEDFPVMPVESCTITLKPTNFFHENPALDVPPPKVNRNRDEL